MKSQHRSYQVNWEVCASKVTVFLLTNHVAVNIILNVHSLVLSMPDTMRWCVREIRILIRKQRLVQWNTPANQSLILFDYFSSLFLYSINIKIKIWFVCFTLLTKAHLFHLEMKWKKFLFNLLILFLQINWFYKERKAQFLLNLKTLS